MAKLNKKLFYKIGLPIGSIGTIVAPLATLVACEDGTGTSTDNWKFSSHRIVQTVESTASGVSYVEESGIHLMNTPLSNSSQDTVDLFAAAAATSLTLFRFVQPSFDVKKFDANGNITGILPKRETKKRFEMASGVIIHIGNNKEEFLYDTDEDPDAANKKYSINGQHLQDVINAGGITEFEFKMNPKLSEHHWIRQLSGEKGASLSPRDLLRGLQIGIMGVGQTRAAFTSLPLLNPESNPKAMTVQTIDAAINGAMLIKYKGYKNPLVTGDKTASQGLFYDSNYGLQGKKIIQALFDPQLAREFVPNEQTFKLPIDSSVKLDGVASKSLWDSLFGKQSYFAAVSDDETKKQIATKDDELKNIIGEEAFNKIKGTELYASGLYQRIISPRDGQFVAGQYYFAESTAKLTVFKQNEDYIDDRWLNQVNSKKQKTTVQELRIKTITQSDITKTTLANEYKAGTSATSAFDNFGAAQQIDILQNMKKWGLYLSAPFTSSKVSGGLSYFSLNPLQDGNGKIFFNNNFAKLFYGDTLQNIQKNNDLSESIEYQTAGNGIQFRTNLAALANATGFTKLISKTGISTSISWFTPFAPEGSLGKDKNGADVLLSNVMLDENGETNNGVDEEKVVNVNVVNVDIDPATGKTTKVNTTQIPYMSYLHQVSKTDETITGPSTDPSDKLPTKPNSTIHYSPFEWIQKNINESINRSLNVDYPVGKYASPKDVPENEKMTFELPVANGAFFQTDQYVEAYTKFKALIQKIDPRLNPVAAVNPAREDGKDANGNKVVDATVKIENFSKDFYVSKPATGDKPYEDWRQRYRYYPVGYSIAPLPLGGGTYSIDSPAAVMFENLGYLQTGVLFQLSYLANQTDFTKAKYGVLSQVKPMIDFLIKKFNEAQGTQAAKDGFWSTDFENRFKSKFKADIFDALRTYKFEDLYKSKPNEVAKYDYIGMKGLEKIKNLQDMSDYAAIEDKDEATQRAAIKDPAQLAIFDEARKLTDDEKEALNDDLAIAGDSTALFFKNAATAFDVDVLSKQDVQFKLDVMQGFETLNYQQFQPVTAYISDRRNLIPTLVKSWLTKSSQDLSANLNLGRWRVDLDHEDDNYLKPAVIYNKDEFGNTIVY